MDVLVLIEECEEPAGGSQAVAGAQDAQRPRPLAYVHSAPDPRGWPDRGDRRTGSRGRDVVTLCAPVDADRLALALAAAVEGSRTDPGAAAPGSPTMRHLGVWEGLGAAGDTAWRDRATGQLVSQDVAIPYATLEATARQLLADAGRLIRQTAADLLTEDWPEGARRAISFTLPLRAVAGARRDDLTPDSADEALLASLRESHGEVGDDVDDDDAQAGDLLLATSRAA